MLSFFPRGVLDEILKLIESVSEDFPSYSFLILHRKQFKHVWHILTSVLILNLKKSSGNGVKMRSKLDVLLEYINTTTKLEGFNCLLVKNSNKLRSFVALSLSIYFKNAFKWILL